MIILIGGASHTGKTLLAKRLAKETGFFTLSLDHLKMGLIRAGITPLTPEDDDVLREYLWPIAAEMVKTAVENRQDLILEGCYIPGNWAASFEKRYLEQIRCVFLVMTENYVRTRLGRIQRFANAAEYRKCDRVDREDLARDNARVLAEANAEKAELILIEDEFDPEEIHRRAASLLGLR